MNNNLNWLYAFLGGAILGAGIAILFAPEKGEDLRNRIKDMLKKKTSKAQGISESDIRYREVIGETLGHEVKLDKRRLRRVNKLMKKAEELYGLGSTNKKFTGSPQTIPVTHLSLAKSATASKSFFK